MSPLEVIPVFVNERPISVPPGADTRAAVAAFDPALAARLGEAGVRLTDGRGIALAADAPVTPGAIVRVVLSARSADEGERHADA